MRALLDTHSFLWFITDDSKLSDKHLTILAELERPHRDPFDRLIIAQAMAEDLPVVGKDPAFRDYPVDLVW